MESFGLVIVSLLVPIPYERRSFTMPIVALPAHFDGKQIHLDEPFHLEPNTRLIVTVLSREEYDEGREAWLELSAQGLRHAYREDEPEYTVNQIKEVNPDYVGSMKLKILESAKEDLKDGFHLSLPNPSALR
ncbi:MAG: hypothetical protein DDT29_02348 [Dehalococcoidia bacterium]|nr:hypothetical protein [Bacillota bacterium]